MFTLSHTLHTAGNGYWSRVSKPVKLTGMYLGYINKNNTFGELRVQFDKTTWNVNKDGLIYTDKLFLSELQSLLGSKGFSFEDVSYSEQGMQGDNYVSLDVGQQFLDSWNKVID